MKLSQNLLFIPLALCVASAGCASVKTSNTARTANEQLLVSNSVDRALSKVDFRPLDGSRVFLQEKYLDSVDKSYLLGSVRHRILRAGGMLVDSADEADVVMELRSGAVGTNNSETFLGVPEITLPGMLTLPEIRFFSRSSQEGYAKIGLVVYDAKSKAVLGEGGVTSAESTDRNWIVMGFGPFQSGTLKAERNRATKQPSDSAIAPLPHSVALVRPRSRSLSGASELLQPRLQFSSDTKVREDL